MRPEKDHAALMDDVYRYQRYVYDFTRKYYLLGRDRLIREMKPGPQARIIEIGCGTARNLIRMARTYPDARLYGLDASAEMLRTAENAIARAGLSRRIKLVQAYAEDLTPALFGETAPFDEAVFSYSLSMIPDWKQALKAAQAALSPRGHVHVVDFGDLKGLGPAEGLLRWWLGLFHVAPREELLCTIEQQRDNGQVKVLSGRYAFLWTSAPVTAT
ncbi:MAG: class I SAM-dependent methyltransferase [Alphaproteobacteria bacterium]|nr:class I SAM-dependent methyltransferase [Alphaproteobacteria bacterium]MBL6937515.1 class I SAM-dependent methyltransferase [Alphaproteobacteria bacterium]MBL7098853.1 class I SAM-dependent methyltransferase [Alphaproteobacteria bacterium]